MESKIGRGYIKFPAAGASDAGLLGGDELAVAAKEAAILSNVF